MKNCTGIDPPSKRNVSENALYVPAEKNTRYGAIGYEVAQWKRRRPFPRSSEATSEPFEATVMLEGTVTSRSAVALSALSSLHGHQVSAYHGSDSVQTSGFAKRVSK